MFSKKLKLALVTSALAIGGLAGFAGAKGFHGGDRAAMKEKFDSNKDGTLDAAEKAKMKEAFAARHAQRKAEVLAKFDANKDGQLDDAERTAMRDTRIAARFTKLDANADGKLTLDEFKAGQGTGHGRHGRRMMGKHRGMKH